MAKVFPVAILLLACYLAVEYSFAQDASTTVAPSPPGNKTCHHGKRRPGRAVANGNHELEQKFKDFAAKLGKTPQDMKAALGSFLQDQGIKMEDIQKSVKESGEAMQRMIESVKTAMMGE